MNVGVPVSDLQQYLNGLLAVGDYKDYGPNGLQVEGRPTVRRIVSGVTASRALIDAAIDAGADALLVHHGLFWRGQDGRLTGWLGERVRRLMVHDINLLAYHLPLDAHAELGNNAQLGLRLGWRADARFGEQALGFAGDAGGLDDAAAIAAGADLFLTGEVSEPQAHLARETGVAFLACGHHATERYGAPALAAHLAERYALEHRFIDIDNPA